MMRCEDCQSLILDHLFGLLDAAEATAVANHLTDCPACMAIREQEAHAQGLIAQAARVSFPQVRFEIPLADVAAPIASVLAKTSAAPVHASRRVRNSWLAWAVAATVLLGAGASLWTIEQRRSRAIDAHNTARASAEQTAALRTAMEAAQRDAVEFRKKAANDVEAAQQKHDATLLGWVEAEKEALRTPAERRLAVRVVKPAALQPGAPNDIDLSVVSAGVTVTAAPVLVEVRDQTGLTIYAAWFNHAGRGLVGHFHIPAEVWTRIKPADELFLAVATVDEKTGAKNDLQEPIRLYGPVYTTQLTTDRVEYRPGDRVFFRSLTLDRVTFQPPPREQFLRYALLRKSPGLDLNIAQVEGSTDLVRLVDGQAEKVLGPDGQPLRGVGSGAIALPADLADGDYTLTLTELPPASGYPPAIAFPVKRSLRVRSGPVDQYQKQVAFEAAGFAPGATARGWVELKAQDKAVANVPLTVVAFAGNGSALRVSLPTPAVTGSDGRARFGVDLPANLPLGEVRVKVMFQTPVRPEFTGARVPVVGRNLIVEFFPEGGTLATGVANRVYVRATMPDGRPVDLRGSVTDGRDLLARVETLRDANEPGVNRGLGSFTFTPTPGTRYWLKIDEPQGPFAGPIDPYLAPGAFPLDRAALFGMPAILPLRSGFLLPSATDEAVVLTALNPVSAPGEPIRVQLTSVGRDRNLVVGAYTRGRPADVQRVVSAAGKPVTVELIGQADARGGVVRITAFEDRDPALNNDKFHPVAERLVYRRPTEQLNLAVSASPAIAGKPVELGIIATDERDQPKPAVLFAAVTDAAGTSEANGRMLTSQFLLAGEVQNPDDLEYADFLLTDQAEAAVSLDLVLATQGWRRFAEQRQARGERSPLKGQLLASNGAYPVVVNPSEARQQQVFDKYSVEYDAAAQQLESATRAKLAADDDPSRETKAANLLAEYEKQRRELALLTEKSQQSLESLQSIPWRSAQAIAVMVVLAFALTGFVAVRRPRIRTALPLCASAIACLLLAAYLGLASRDDASAEIAAAGVEAPAPPQPEPRTNTTDFGTVERAKETSAKQDRKSPAATRDDGNRRFGAALPPLKNGFVPVVGGGGFGLGGGFAPMKTQEQRNAIESVPAPPAPGGPPTAAHPADAAPTPGPNGFAADKTTQTGSIARGGENDAKRFVPDLLLRKATKDEAKSRIAIASAVPDVVEFHGDDRKYLQTLEKASEVTRKREAAATDLIRGLDEKQFAVPAAEPQVTTSFGKAKQYFSIDRLALDRVSAGLTRPQPLIVREFAAPRPGSDNATPETVLWQPVIVLPADGKARLTYTAGNIPSGYEIVVAGHTLDGRIGATRLLVPVLPK